MSYENKKRGKEKAIQETRFFSLYLVSRYGPVLRFAVVTAQSPTASLYRFLFAVLRSKSKSQL